MIRRFFLLFLLLSTLISCRSAKQDAPKALHANILLITMDTTRPDHLSPYGSANSTPNLRELANSGILFENAFAQAPLTFPSHTSILTGLFPVHHGVHHNGLEIFNQPQFLIGNLLRQHGYKTGAVVSSFVLDRKFGLAESFDVFDDRMERLPGISSNFEVERHGDKTLEAGIKILESFAGNKWFLWLHFYDPHTPYAPPSPLEGYDGEITYVDQQIGKLREWLARRKLDQNTITIVIGDHGESLGEHGEATHGFFVYNSTLKVPLILSYPAAKAGTKIPAAVASVDIVPTILELTGIQDSQKRDGESLLRMITGDQRKNDIYFESRYPEQMGWNVLQGLVHQNWKFISTTRSELYDWQKDDAEAANLYSQKEREARSLKTSLASFLKTSSSVNSQSAQPNQETLEKLRSLGYISSTNVSKSDRTADPKDKIEAFGLYEKSMQLIAQGKLPEAVETLKRLGEKEPKNNFFRVALASGYRQIKKYPEAIQELKEAIQNDPADSTPYHELALVYKDDRNYAEAIKAQQAALTIDPNRSDYHSVLGLLMVETGRFAEAQKEFNFALKRDPNNPTAWNNLGNALREMNDLDQAERAYKKAIELSPHYAYPLNGLATILIRKDRTREAIPYLEKALDLDPKYVEVYLNLAIAYHTLGEREKAKTLYRTFLKIAPDWMATEKRNAQNLLSQIS